jgi:histidinol-phosphate aminotransferase
MRIKKAVKDLIPYPPGKPIEELTREYGVRKPIKLASNENPLGPSPKALLAIRRALPNLHRYPDGSGFYLKQALGKVLGCSPEAILLGNGSNEIIELALKTFLRPGDEVVSPFPSFLVYEKAVKAFEGKNIQVPLKGFSLDLKAMAQRITPKTRVIIVNNPNNPTGTAFRRKEWETFLEAVPKGVLILLDEAYIDFADDPQCPKGTDYLGAHRNLLVVRTFSKAYGLAGLRIGYGVTAPDIADYMNRVRQPFNVNALALAGALGALEDEAFYRRTLALVQRGKRALERGLSQMGLSFVPSQTNFLLIRVPVKGQAVYEAMLPHGVIIRSMKSFGLEDYIRVNVGLPEENRRFLQVLKKVLAQSK